MVRDCAAACRCQASEATFDWVVEEGEEVSSECVKELSRHKKTYFTTKICKIQKDV